jgi:hypothetical protein
VSRSPPVSGGDEEYGELQVPQLDSSLFAGQKLVTPDRTDSLNLVALHSPPSSTPLPILTLCRTMLICLNDIAH